MADVAYADWARPCLWCGHEMHNHILDLELDPEVDCTVPGCNCNGYTPAPIEESDGGPI